MAWPEFENGWQSPRISFALDLSQTDRTSPDKRSTVGAADIIHSPDFEFCKVSNVNGGRIADFGETFISADLLFGDGMILPQIRTTEAQPLTIARHLSLETSRCPSPVRSASYPPSKESGVENAAFKSAHRPSGRWKEMFKLSNKDYFCAAGKEADQDAKESTNDAKPPPARSRWPFSRSGGERRGNALFCALPFSRSKSAVERNKSVPCSEASCCRSKSVGAQTAYKETQTLLVSGPKPADTKCEDDKRLPDLPKRKGSPGRAMRSCPSKTYGRGSPGRGNNRFVVRNSKTLDSPRPGKSMAEGSLKTSYNIPGVSMKVNPVLNVPAYIGPVGGRNGPGLFGFRGLFSKKDSNKRSHHSQYTASRKKGA